ncbi:MAG: hypothetical protein HDT33_01980 [Clostridiales bacterium]|nr:hypothetical protein [Clostridiales bacterium]
MKSKTFWSQKSVLGIVLSIAAMLLFGILGVPEGLTREGLLSVGLFLSAIILWVTEAFPICVSAIGLIALMPLFNIMSYNDAMSRFGVGTVLFIMATGGITITLTRTTIPLRITAGILRITKGSARLIILGFSLVGALLSGIMSSLATCALFFGIVNTMLKTADCKPGQSQLGKALMIALPVCCGIGGFLTPAGTPGNILMMELMEGYGIHMTFAQWTAIGMPIGLLAILVVALWLPVVFKPEGVSAQSKDAIFQQYAKLGKWTAYEKKTVAIILGMLVCWFAGSWIPFLNTTTVAVLGMVVMFLPGVDLMDWKTFQQESDWNLVFIMGTASILVSGVSQTGAMEWLVTRIFADLGSLPPALMWVLISILVCVLRAFIPTTTAVIALFAPMLYSIASMTGANPGAMLMIPAFWAPAAMLMLYTEPIFLITFGEGYYTEGDLLKFGWLPSLVMAVVIALAFPVLLPALGF